MRQSRFTEEQIIGILQEVEAGAEARAACRREGITEQTFYRWRRKYGGMQVSGARRLKQLAAQRKRWGYRMVHTVLRREGWSVN